MQDIKRIREYYKHANSFDNLEKMKKDLVTQMSNTD